MFEQGIDKSQWIQWTITTIGAWAVAAVLWLLRLEKRLNAKLDIERYERELRERMDAWGKRSDQNRDEILAKLEKLDTEATTHRHNTANELHAVQLKLAVITAQTK